MFLFLFLYLQLKRTLYSCEQNIDSSCPQFDAHFKSFTCNTKSSHTAWKKSIFGVIQVHIFHHSDWIRRDTEYLSYSVRMRKNTDQNTSVTLILEIVAQWCSVKKVFLEIMQNSQENTDLFLIKLQASLLMKRLGPVFSCEFCNLRTTFLTEHLWCVLL